MEWIYGIATLASAIAAILAWVAKLRWSKEFAKAKDATIAAKEAQIEVLRDQIEGLRDLTPAKMREHYNAVKDQLTEFNDALKGQLEEAENEIGTRETTILKLESEGVGREREISILQTEKEELKKRTVSLQKEADSIRALVTPRFDLPSLQLASLDSAREAALALSHSLAEPKWINQINMISSDISKSLLASEAARRLLLSTLNYNPRPLKSTRQTPRHKGSETAPNNETEEKPNDPGNGKSEEDDKG